MTTRTARTQASSVIQDPAIETIDLPNTAANRKFAADWAEMKANKSYWETREDEMKAELDGKIGYKSMPKKKGDKLFVRIAGAIRFKIGWAERTDTDRDLLLQGYPEAYEATKRVTTYASVKAG